MWSHCNLDKSNLHLCINCNDTVNVVKYPRDWARFNVPPSTLHVILRTVLLVSDPTNSVKALKEDRFLRIRLQSHQVHPTALTILQQLCSVKQKHTKYKHKHKWIYAKWSGRSVTNPIHRPERTVHLSVLMTVHSFNTQYNKSALQDTALTSF